VWWVRPFFQRARPLRYIRPVTDYSRHRVYRWSISSRLDTAPRSPPSAVRWAWWTSPRSGDPMSTVLLVKD